MKAIALLRKAGMSRRQIAEGADVKAHTIGMYERGDRFPGRAAYVCLVELAESRGITLLARDFIDARDACEPDEGEGA